jgi:hypothetical protein
VKNLTKRASSREEVLAAQQRMRRRPRCVIGSWLFSDYYIRGGHTYL